MKREAWVKRHNPILKRVSPESPLSIGNGNFVFTADCTGLQTLYSEYMDETPLCTMANWGWHVKPANDAGGKYTLADVKMDEYDFCGRKVRYAKSRMPGNEDVYDWLRVNPHKANLARVGFRLNGEEIRGSQLSAIRQHLKLYEGILESSFELDGRQCKVCTFCDTETDTLVFEADSELLGQGLSVDIDFPYGSETISGSEWQAEELHETILEEHCIQRRMDDLQYTIRLNIQGGTCVQTAAHQIRISAEGTHLSVMLSFSKNQKEENADFDALKSRTREWWNSFWEKGGMVDLSVSSDRRASELERRIVLSLYLLAINSSGNMPPAETGLICNSWYGKAHLEMHFWHMAWAPLWGHSELLMRCLPWYHEHLPEAWKNAARNGYKGARWPKMIAYDAIDSPSDIAVLLVWQQPHIITMLELIRRTLLAENEESISAFMAEQWPLVRETAIFMADYVVRDPQTDIYHIEPPVIPVQERYMPEDTRDPSFEVAYWKFGLGIAICWAEMMEKAVPEKWRDVYEHMAEPPMADGLYVAHSNCPETFATTATDHPSMLQCLGTIPGGGIDRCTMKRTLKKVIEVWDYQSLWGWDFAVMAMCATSLGLKELAVEQLLCPTEKNTFVASGNNRQRNDLPLYLPGNGSLLLAVAQMAAGFDGSEPAPGFGNGWNICCEGVHRYF